MKKIIAFIGFEGSGKDYRTNEILKDKSFTRVGMSDAIREMAFKKSNVLPMYGEPYEQWKKDIVYYDKDSSSRITGRHLLLKVGEGERKKNPYVWSEKWFEKADNLFPKNIVVNDCRFWHEVRSILKLSILNGYEPTFIYCEYKSDKFRVSTEKPDQLAYTFFENKFNDNSDVTHLIKEMAMYTNDTF